MQTTLHIQQRMSQRGISHDMVAIVMAHGKASRDRHILDRRGALKRLEELQKEERVLKKILDKGGVTVVAADGALITTFNRESKR
jgi:hypothetical protein